MTRVLIVSNDPVSDQMPGPAIRAWNLADVLSTKHEVTLVSTVECSRTSVKFECKFADPSQRRRLERSAEVALITGGTLHDWPSLAHVDAALVVDMYDPYHLENLEAGPRDDARNRNTRVQMMSKAINEHLGRGDYFLCATERQRDFWLGSLASIGRINPYQYDVDPTFSTMLGIVPFGVPVEKPHQIRAGLRGSIEGIAQDDKVVLWAGGVYNWFDPVTLVRAMPKVVEQVPTAKLVFLGMRNPNPAIPTMKAAADARNQADALGLSGTTVVFNDGWVPYDDRANFLVDANVGVSTHLEHIETRFSFRTRVLDYLWASLPMVLTEGDVLADELREAGLARTVRPGDVDELALALISALDQDRPSNESFELIRQRYYWPTVAVPLVRFCDSPNRASDLEHMARQNPIAPPSLQEPDSYTRTVPPPMSAASQLRERAIGGLIRTIAANTADEAVRRVNSRIDEVERILSDQGDAADEVAEVIGRTLTRLSAEVTALTSEVSQLRERLQQLKSST